MVRRRFATFLALSLITGVMAWLGGGGAEAIYMNETNIQEGNVPIPLGIATTRAYGLTASSVTTTQLADLGTFRPTVTAGNALRIDLISSGVSPDVSRLRSIPSLTPSTSTSATPWATAPMPAL